MISSYYIGYAVFLDLDARRCNLMCSAYFKRRVSAVAGLFLDLASLLDIQVGRIQRGKTRALNDIDEKAIDSKVCLDFYASRTNQTFPGH